MFKDVSAYERAVAGHVAVRIREECRARSPRIRQAELARMVGLHPDTLSSKMLGRTLLRLGELYAVADALDMHPTDLLPTYGELQRAAGRGR